VTGATGFIGSHLVESLLQRGQQVRCLVRKTSNPRWLTSFSVEFAYGDCSDKASLREAVRDVDEVFHVAGVTKTTEEKTYFDINAFGTQNLIQACLENSPYLRKFIYVSSQAAAGPCCNGGKKRESDQCIPVSSYGQSKRMGEEFALAQAHRLPLIILRPSAVYGPRDRDIYSFFKLVTKRIKPRLYGLDQHFSLCYVQDVVDAILLAANTQETHGEIFFLSDGADYRLDEIGDIIARAMEIRAVSVRIPGWMISGVASLSELVSRTTGRPPLINRGKVEEMIQQNWVCDITKARSRLGFQPKIGLPEGARLTFEWYRKENWL
jgi:nucleoside-diphosphate-sugar epimerase